MKSKSLQTTHLTDPARLDSGDEPICNPLVTETFARVLDQRLRRRSLLQGGLGAAVALVFASPAASLAREIGHDPAAESGLLGFEAIPTSSADSVVVPDGYQVQIILPWGEPITGEYPKFDDRAADNTAEEQAEQVGMHHDGMHFFPARDDSGNERSDAGLLVINHEYIDWLFLHPDGPDLEIPRPVEQVRKELNAHGISIVELKRGEDGQWDKQRSDLNRRITASTPTRFTGPAAGHRLLQTRFSPDGTRGRGTFNNCSHGVTPWGTYLACEENWSGYFANTGDRHPREQARYGVRSEPGRLGLYSRSGWHTVRAEDDPDHEFRRFDATVHGEDATEDFRNEPNQFGWIVEFDPNNSGSSPVKHTAMGRFAHEGVVFQAPREGRRLVAYSGDDARFEYIYKYVSREPYHADTAGPHLLDDGTLYVARFDDDGRGRWIPLRHDENGLNQWNGFHDQGEVLVNTRTAADRVGATPMDRPEWGAVHPDTGEVYFTLTNNGDRPAHNRDAANPRGPNPFGHIIRWHEDQPLPGPGEASTGFRWDIFVFAGDENSGSVNDRALTEANIFAAPDGLWFDPDGRLWIQTDIGRGDMNRGRHATFGNNQMLCADPVTGDIRRFLTGPVGQEITGCITTPDQTTLFVNVQHPGENTSTEQFKAGQWTSHWPGGGDTRPRSATLAITRTDGGKIGA